MKAVIAVAALAAAAVPASAQTDLALWTFETSVPTTAGPHAAEGGVFAASSQASAVFASSAAVFSNPVGNGSFESFSANTWAIGDYYEFSTSAIGYTNLAFSWMQTRSSTGPGTFDVLLSINGGAFTTLVNDYTVPAVTWSSLAPVDMGSVFAPVPLPAAADNATTLVFRLVNQVSPGGAAGTCRVDNVLLQSVPAPGAVALVGLGGLLAARRRR